MAKTPISMQITPEYQQGLRMQPACDRVLCQVFGITTDKIHRTEERESILDQKFAIDLILELPNGTRITGQEKALSFDKSKYDTFTVEFYQNRFTKEKGEFFKLASQFYLSGYSDQTGEEFLTWKIIDVLKLMQWLKDSNLEALESRTKPSTSNASFLPIPYKSLPDYVILAQKE